MHLIPPPTCPIGPSGASIRDICKLTNATIRSQTSPCTPDCQRSHRVFYIEGERPAMLHALGIICDAVDRYKDLSEGKYAGWCGSEGLREGVILCTNVGLEV
jgi:hypothetical protein